MAVPHPSDAPQICASLRFRATLPAIRPDEAATDPMVIDLTPDPDEMARMIRALAPVPLDLDGSGTPAPVLAALALTPRRYFLAGDHDAGLVAPVHAVAAMVALAAPGPGDRVLEVGTGLGFQAAVLARLAARVDSIEIRAAVAAMATANLQAAGVAAARPTNVRVHVGDGAHGLAAAAPFDAIIVAASLPDLDHLPPALAGQLAPGGRLVVPVGPASAAQPVMVLRRLDDGMMVTRSLAAVRLAPLVTRPAEGRGR